MARHSSLWFRKQTNFWYTTLDGKQVKLSQDKKEAQQALHTLLANRPEPETCPTDFRPSVRKIADLWLDHQQATKKPDTYRMHKFYLQSFCDFVGKKKVADIKVHTVTAWIDHHKDWQSESTKTGARAAVQACFNWALGQDLIPANPVAKMKRGGYKKRERLLTAEEKKAIYAAAHHTLKPFLFVLEKTGARPFSEIAQLTAQDIDWQRATATLRNHKNAGKGKHRVIYFTPEVMDVLRQQAERFPAGPLFRSHCGNPYTAFNTSRRLLPLCQKLGIPPMSAYSYRHALITEALAKGMTADIVAELVGNSAVTIARNYSHLCQKTDLLREAMLKAVS